uniref:Uncharacterized protein n=3 Tax=Aegilops tauschii subsp. strangulata TaxID=200361 RepID=A0A453NGP1_AEGTS
SVLASRLHSHNPTPSSPLRRRRRRRQSSSPHTAPPRPLRRCARSNPTTAPCDATASGRPPSPSVSSSPGTSCSEWARAVEVKARSRQAAVTRWGARRRRRSTSPVSPIPFRWWRDGAR